MARRPPLATAPRHAIARGVTAGATVGLLPVLGVQGARVMRSVPDVPEAPGSRWGREGAGDLARRVLVIGESTAAGVGASHQRSGLAGQLAEALVTRHGGAVQWRVVGRSGLRAHEVHRWLLPAVAPCPVDLAVVVLGVNDTKGLTRPGLWRRRMRALVAALQERTGARLVICTGVPPMADFPSLPRPLRDVLGARSRVMDAELARAVAPLDGAVHQPFTMAIAPELFCRDGFHPGDEGYRRWAGLLADLTQDDPWWWASRQHM